MRTLVDSKQDTQDGRMSGDKQTNPRTYEMSENDPCTAWEERAAILEYCAGMSRADAERRAREMQNEREKR